MMQVRSVQHLLALSDSDLSQLPIPAELADQVLVASFTMNCFLVSFVTHGFCAVSLISPRTCFQRRPVVSGEH